MNPKVIKLNRTSKRKTEINMFGAYDYDYHFADWDTDPVADTDLIELEVDALDLENHHIVEIGYQPNPEESPNGFRPLGTIQAIGSSTYTFHEGRRIILTAYQSCWFNLKNNTTASVHSSTRKIWTGTQGDLNNLIKCVLVYETFLSKWVVESYETFQGTFLYNTIAIAPDIDSDYDFSIGAVSKPGKWEFDVYVAVSEYEAGGVARANTTAFQSLKVYNLGVESSSYSEVCRSGIFTAIDTSSKWHNLSLQGSGKVVITSDLNFKIRVSLPNGVLRGVDSGYAHLRFLSEA